MTDDMEATTAFFTEAVGLDNMSGRQGWGVWETSDVQVFFLCGNYFRSVCVCRSTLWFVRHVRCHGVV